jgi:purine-binding chemotaxis protein CheW
MSETLMELGTTAKARAGKYLSFQLDAETYGIEILKVQEIIGIMNVTHVPRTPTYVRGVVNLRGKVIPVVDLRLKFDLDAQEDTDRTCIIVVYVSCNGVPVTMGIIVDEVSEVMDIRLEQLEPAPSFGASVDTDFILGMGKVGQKVILILDVDRVLTYQEVDYVADLVEDQPPA